MAQTTNLIAHNGYMRVRISPPAQDCMGKLKQKLRSIFSVDYRPVQAYFALYWLLLAIWGFVFDASLYEPLSGLSKGVASYTALLIAGVVGLFGATTCNLRLSVAFCLFNYYKNIEFFILTVSANGLKSAESCDKIAHIIVSGFILYKVLMLAFFVKSRRDEI